MLGMVELLVRWLSSLVKSRRRLEAENLVLRHQLNFAAKGAQVRPAVQCRPSDLRVALSLLPECG